MKTEPWEELRKKLLALEGARLIKKRDVRITITSNNLKQVSDALGITNPPLEVEKFVAHLATITKFKHTEEFLCTFDEYNLRALCEPVAATSAA